MTLIEAEVQGSCEACGALEGEGHRPGCIVNPYYGFTLYRSDIIEHDPPEPATVEVMPERVFVPPVEYGKPIPVKEMRDRVFNLMESQGENTTTRVGEPIEEVLDRRCKVPGEERKEQLLRNGQRLFAGVVSELNSQFPGGRSKETLEQVCVALSLLAESSSLK